MAADQCEADARIGTTSQERANTSQTKENENGEEEEANRERQ